MHVNSGEDLPIEPDDRSLAPSRAEQVRAIVDIVNSSPLWIDRLTRVAQRALAASGVFVSLIDGRLQTIISASGFTISDELRQMPISASICRHVIAVARPVVIDDAAQHPLCSQLPVVRDGTIAAYLGVPLTLDSGITIGALCAIQDTPRVWRAADIDILNDIAASLLSELDLLSRRQEALLLRPSTNQQHLAFAGLGLGEAIFEPAGLLMLADPAPAFASTPTRRHVLVADAGPGLNSQFYNLLHGLDYQIDCVSGEANTLSAMETHDYAMVFVDICDDERGGIKAALAIRRLDNRKGEVPIVALSMNGSRQSIDACSKSGIDALLVVPVTRQSLQETMEALTAG